MEKGWQLIYVGNKMHLIEIVKAVLADNDIPSVIVNKSDSSYISIGDIEVYVAEENAILARVLIEQNQL